MRKRNEGLGFAEKSGRRRRESPKGSLIRKGDLIEVLSGDDKKKSKNGG